MAQIHLNRSEQRKLVCLQRRIVDLPRPDNRFTWNEVVDLLGRSAAQKLSYLGLISRSGSSARPRLFETDREMCDHLRDASFYPSERLPGGEGGLKSLKEYGLPREEFFSGRSRLLADGGDGGGPGKSTARQLTLSGSIQGVDQPFHAPDLQQLIDEASQTEKQPPWEIALSDDDQLDLKDF